MAAEKVKSRFGAVTVLFDHRKVPRFRRFEAPGCVKDGPRIHFQS